MVFRVVRRLGVKPINKFAYDWFVAFSSCRMAWEVPRQPFVWASQVHERTGQAGQTGSQIWWRLLQVREEVNSRQTSTNERLIWINQCRLSFFCHIYVSLFAWSKVYLKYVALKDSRTESVGTNDWLADILPITCFASGSSHEYNQIYRPKLCLYW